MTWRIVSVIVPYVPDGGWRDEAWKWVYKRYEAALPGAEVVQAGPQEVPDHPGVFNFADAVNQAVAASSGEVLIITEADTAFDITHLRRAIASVRSHEAFWALPLTYFKLTQRATQELLELDPATAQINDLAIASSAYEWQGWTHWAGGLVVPRAAFERVRGADARHRGWGWWDVCFAMSLRTLWGEATRYPGAAYHLWHPQPLEHTFGQPWNDEQRELTERYQAAFGNEPQMQALVDEHP